MTMPLHPKIKDVTERIQARSETLRADYVARMEKAHGDGSRGRLSCGNLAHGFAAAPLSDKLALRSAETISMAVVTAYNDVLSAHQPFARFPELIKDAAQAAGAVAQVAGGVPAMCDGVTQGQPGMELSLFSRDVIAMATAIALSHNTFDAVLCLGVCDKIVPGLLIGALSFGQLPTIFVPAGPMPSGLPNREKSRVRTLYAEGKATRQTLLEAECASYHTAGTCTFYGTANSNQMLMEIMGLHLPGAAFVNPQNPLRDALTRAAAQRVAQIAKGEPYLPLWQVMTEKVLVNGMVGLLATGGSTNHTIHLVAIARAAGFIIDWDDFDALSKVTPLLARIYPNGAADVNAFHAAGGTGFVIRELLDGGLLHPDVATVFGNGLRAYTTESALADDGTVMWHQAPCDTRDGDVLRPLNDPFQSEGGLRLLAGNLGRAVIKVSAVTAPHRCIEAPARVFSDQDALIASFQRGELDRDFVAVVRFQGPRANGMPELHKLTPTLSVLQDRGLKVALVSDGRMSGASGRIPAAIHLSPEAARAGPIARILDGDVIRLDAVRGSLDVLVDEAEFAVRPAASLGNADYRYGLGRELFGAFRNQVSEPETGAQIFFDFPD